MVQKKQIKKTKEQAALDQKRIEQAEKEIKDLAKELKRLSARAVELRKDIKARLDKAKAEKVLKEISGT